MNRAAFAEAMRTGADAAWDGNWEQAIAAYQKALAESPRDVDALTALGLACFNAGRLDDALAAYRQASEVAPDNPVLLERIGNTYEGLGRAEAAADAYLASANQYVKQPRNGGMAVERWHDAVRIFPGHIQAHAQLLQHYQRTGKVKEAVGVCLKLARLYQARGQLELAAQICRYGLKLAPHNLEVQAALDSILHADQAPAQPSGETLFGAGPEPAAAEPSPVDLDLAAIPGIEVAEERGSPVDAARQQALADLAGSILEEDDAAMAGALIARAIDFQTRGSADEAIAAYEKALAAGSRRPAGHFSLGLLYQEKLRLDDAIAQFEQVGADPAYRLGSAFALGECYRGQGRSDDALKSFIEALKVVDLATVPAQRADELAQVYESLAASYLAGAGREQALELTNQLVQFLSRKGWQDRAAQIRERLDTLSQDGPSMSLLEMLATPDVDRILGALAHTQVYTEHGWFYAALEECYYALGRAPAHLPIHRQLVQVLVSMGRVDDAVAKLVAVADTYWVRGDMHQAVAMYNEALRLAPMDTGVRARLTRLLASSGRADEALEHSMILADTHYQMAQMDEACDVYQEALQIAPRGSPDRQWDIRILHEIGDIALQRVDWKRAAGVYEEIKQRAPEDERARLALVQLHYRFNRPDLATAELDGLLELLRKSGKLERIFAILEDAVRERPDDIPLQTRLAQAYLNAGQADKALVQLDRLGDLQMEAGRRQDARATIRAIVALNPPNVADYRDLLEQLG